MECRYLPFTLSIARTDRFFWHGLCMTGLKGQLNMSQSMEDLSKAFILNEWPGRNPFSQCAWEKLAWPSKKRCAVAPVLHRS